MFPGMVPACDERWLNTGTGTYHFSFLSLLRGGHDLIAVVELLPTKHYLTGLNFLSAHFGTLQVFIKINKHKRKVFWPWTSNIRWFGLRGLENICSADAAGISLAFNPSKILTGLLFKMVAMCCTCDNHTFSLWSFKAFYFQQSLDCLYWTSEKGANQSKKKNQSKSETHI